MFFRATCADRAAVCGVAGWVTNRPDGSVEAVFEGEDADVTAMVDWARTGPPHAHVTRVEVSDEPPQGESEFSVR